MDSTKNFLDAWINTQTKFVDNLVDTSKKIQNSLKQGDVIEKSVEMYQNWLKSQKGVTSDILEKFIKSSPSNEGSEFFKNWMESQMALGKQWMEFLSTSASGKSDDKGMKSYMENVQSLYSDWNAIYNKLVNQFGKPTQGLNYTPGDLNIHSFTSLIDNTRTYMKMFELWQPIYKMLQSNTLGLDSLNKFLGVDKYREVLNSIFHFTDAEKSNNFLGMIKQYQDMILSSTGVKGFQNLPFTRFFEEFSPSKLLSANLNSLAEIAYKFSSQFHQFINPYFTMIPAGREKEMLGLTFDIQEKYTQYYIKSLTMQNMVYTAGQASIEKSVKKMMSKYQENSELANFDEFYMIWVNTMEEDMIALFGSAPYSKLQGELLQIGLGIKNKLDKLMEHMLSPLPVVPRSEIDEMNATIYELKSKVRKLESELRHSAQEEITDAPNHKS